MPKVQAPNFTAVPNILLDNLHDLSLAKLKVMIVLCRQTFGWNRTEIVLSVTKLSELSGLSESSVKIGIASLLEKEWIRRQPNRLSFEYEINLEVIGEPSRNSAPYPAEIRLPTQPNSDGVSSRNSAPSPSRNSADLYKDSTLNKEVLDQGENPKPSKGTPKAPKFDPNDVVLPREFDTPEFRSAWADFVVMRIEIKEPLTARAVQLGIGELKKLATDATAAIEIIHQAVFRRYRGFFPLKTNTKTNYENHRTGARQGFNRGSCNDPSDYR